MPKIYKRICNTCGQYYEGRGSMYCSKKCRPDSKKGKFITSIKTIEKMKLGSRKRFSLSDGSWYPFIPVICECLDYCNETIWKKRKKYISGHRRPSIMKGKHPKLETKYKIKIGNTKICLYDEFGNKEIYPPIPSLCLCGCKEIVYGNKNYISGHNPSKRAYIDGRSFLPYCEKFNNRFKEQVRIRDGNICQLCGKTQEENGRKLDVHHIHHDKSNCYPDCIALCKHCNLHEVEKKDMTKYYEDLFMNNLNNRGLLFWTNMKEETRLWKENIMFFLYFKQLTEIFIYFNFHITIR
jgi:hypothetical protein